MLRCLSTTALLLIVAILAASLPVYSEAIWIDPITGSTKYQSRWLIFDRPARIERSAIDEWIDLHEGTYVPLWTFLGRGTRSSFGLGVSRACSLAPPIYPLHRGELNAKFVRVSTAEQMAEFVKVMRTGTQEEQEKAVEAVLERTLDGK